MKQSEITQNETDAVEDGYAQLVDIRDASNPKEYVGGRWQAVDNGAASH